MVGRAHQSIIREQRAVTDAQESLFGAYWENLDLSFDKAEIREISFNTAKNVIEKYEWLGCMPAVSLYYYGLYFEDVLGGVVVYSPDYIENLGEWDKYGYTDKIILLSRGVCLHWTPKNSASFLIMGSMKMLPDKYKVVTATIDRAAGEIGTIYQSCNFHYAGTMSTKQGAMRVGYKINGKILGSRSLRAKIGTDAEADVMKAFPQAIKCPQYYKERYFYFLGTKKEKKEMFEAIKHHVKPYPKREIC